MASLPTRSVCTTTCVMPAALRTGAARGRAQVFSSVSALSRRERWAGCAASVHVCPTASKAKTPSAAKTSPNPLRVVAHGAGSTSGGKARPG